MFLDDDDWYLETKIEKQLEFCAKIKIIKLYIVDGIEMEK